MLLETYTDNLNTVNPTLSLLVTTMSKDNTPLAKELKLLLNVKINVILITKDLTIVKIKISDKTLTL